MLFALVFFICTQVSQVTPQQTTTNSFDNNQVNSVTCNTIYPISFEVNNTSNQSKIVALDLQDFSNYALTQTTGNDHQIPVNHFIYNAIMFVDDEGLKFGVTWQTERSFKWLILVKNARASGQSTLKISAQSFSTTIDTSAIADTTNDSLITIAYELATNSSLITIASFKYTTGDLIAAHNIYKGGQANAISVASSVVWQSPYYLYPGQSALAYHKAIHFVFGFSQNLTSNTHTTQDAIEIQYQIDNSSAPFPFRVFNYGNVSSPNSNANSFKNSNFSKVLGISSMNFHNLTEWGQSLIFNNNATLFGPDHCSGPCGVCSPNSVTHDQTTHTQCFYTYNHSIGLSALYFDSIQQNVTNGKLWYYSGTAFLNQKVVGSYYLNQVYWYVSHTGTAVPQQTIREYTYQFNTSSQLTSHVVSSNAPALCMTAQKSSGGTSLYLDDLQLAKEYKLQFDTVANNTCSANNNGTLFFNYDSSQQNFQYHVGVKRFDISASSVVCLAQNTQIEQQNWEYPFRTIYTNAACEVMTNVLLEDQTEQVIFLVQMRFRRVKSLNFEFLKQYLGNFWPDCQKYSPPTQQQYTAYKLPYFSAFNFFGFSPSLISSDSMVNPSIFGGMPKFWFAGSYTNDNKTYLVVDTSVNTLRQSTINITTDTITITSVDMNGANDTNSNNFPDTTGTYQYLDVQTPWSGINSMSPIFNDVISQAQHYFKVMDAVSIKFDWNNITKPAIQLLGMNETMISRICLALDPIFLTNSGMHTINFDVDPVTNCKDRTYGQGYQNYFTAILTGIDWLSANPSSVSIKLNQSIMKPGNVPQIQISLEPQKTTYGLHEHKLNFTYRIGIDSLPFNWEQLALILDQCQPSDLEWSLYPSEQDYPKKLSILLGQPLFQIGMPLPTITTKTLKNILKVQSMSQNASAYNYTLRQIIDSESTELDSMIQSQIYVKDGNLNVKFPESFLGQLLYANFVLKASVMLPYKHYYYDPSSNSMIGQLISITTKQTLFNLTVYAHVVPNFSAPLLNHTILGGRKLVYILPKLTEQEFFNVYVSQVQSVPSNTFSSYQISKKATGNSIVFTPPKNSQNQTYVYQIMLQDDAPFNQISTYQFHLTVIGTDVIQKLSNYNPLANLTQYYADPGYKLQLLEVDKEGTVSFLFSQTTSELVNLSYGQNISVIDLVQNGYLRLKHFQSDVYSSATKSMPNPTFNVTKFNGRELQIKVNFPDPALLSTSHLQRVDQLQFIFNDTQIFCTLKFGVPSDLVWTLNTKIPVITGYQNSFVTQSVASAAASASSGFKGIMTGNLILNVMMATSMDKLWGTLNILQLVLHTPLLQIQLSDFAYGFCSALVSIVSFQIFSAAPLTNLIFGDQNFSSEALNPLNDRFNLLGYTTLNIIVNMDLALYILFSFILTTPLFIYLKLQNWIYPTMPFQKLEIFIKNTLKFSWFLRFFLESNFPLLITSQLQIFAISKVTSWVDIFSSVLGVLFMLILAAMPIFSYIVLSKLHKQQQLEDQGQKSRYGELYEAQMREQTTKQQLLYNVFFMLRRILSYVCIFFITTVPALQIGIQAFICIIWSGYAISERPFEDPDLNVIEVINNMLYWVILIFSFGLTFAVDSQNTLNSLGYLFSALILLMLLTNVTFMLVGVIHQLLLTLKKMYIYMKYHYWKDITAKKKIDLNTYRVAPIPFFSRERKTQNPQATPPSQLSLEVGQTFGKQKYGKNPYFLKQQKIEAAERTSYNQKILVLQTKSQPTTLLKISEQAFEENQHSYRHNDQRVVVRRVKGNTVDESEQQSAELLNHTPRFASPLEVQKVQAQQQLDSNNLGNTSKRNAKQNVPFVEAKVKPFVVKIQNESQKQVAASSYPQDLFSMTMKEKIQRLNTNQNNQNLKKDMFVIKTDKKEFFEPKFTIEQCRLRLQYAKSNVEKTFWNKKLLELLDQKAKRDELLCEIPNSLSYDQI